MAVRVSVEEEIDGQRRRAAALLGPLAAGRLLPAHGAAGAHRRRSGTVVSSCHIYLWSSSFTRSVLNLISSLCNQTDPCCRVAEGEVVVGGHICDPYYKSVSTEDDDDDDLESEGLRLEEDESEVLVDGDEDGGPATRGSVSGNKKSGPFVMPRQPASFRSVNVAAAEVEEESSEPLVPRREAKRANDAEAMVQHPFGGWNRRGSESSLLLVSS